MTIPTTTLQPTRAASSAPTATTKPATTKPTPSKPAPASSTTTGSHGQETQGVATYYAPAAPGGACLTLTIPASHYTAAAGPAQFDGGRACGSYVQVTGARGSILVKIDNLCPECPPGHLDLSNEAFAAIDDPAKGKVPITFHTVRNPSVAGGLVLQVKDGSSQWWLGLQIDNAGNALASVEVADAGSTFRQLTRQSWGWTQTSNPGKGPYHVRITDVYGSSVVVDGVTLTPSSRQATSSRLY